MDAVRFSRKDSNRLHVSSLLALRNVHRQDVPACLVKSRSQVIPDPQGIGHDGEGRIHRPARREHAAVNNVKIVQVVSLAVDIEDRSLGIVPKANRPALVGHPGQRDLLADEQVTSKQPLVALPAMDVALRLLLHQAFEFRPQTLVSLQVVGRVREDDLAVLVQRDPVVGVGQILRRQLEVEGVLGHQIQGEAGGNGRGARAQGHAIQLAHKRDVTHWVLPVARGQIEVIQR